MTTKKNKSEAREFLESLRKGRLTFGQMIKSLRLADDISQVNLADKMGVSRAYLCDVEHGRRTVSIERAALFAKVMGYSESQFVALALEDQLLDAGFEGRIEFKKVGSQ